VLSRHGPLWAHVMKLISRIFLLLSINVLLLGCKLAVISVEGGEVQSRFGTCLEGNVCIIDGLPRENTAEQFIAVPNPGWFFHKWNSGERFICSDYALPECELNFGNIEDDPDLLRKFRASSEVFYLMPVFKDYPRATLGNEPRTITSEGAHQLWLQPADFLNYSYNQVAEVCPDGVCSGGLPGSSTFDLTGYLWASSEDVELLFLAYQQAGKNMLEDFKSNYTGFDLTGVSGLLSDRPKGSKQIPSVGIFNPKHYSTGEFPLYSDKTEPYPGGIWFWRPID